MTIDDVRNACAGVPAVANDGYAKRRALFGELDTPYLNNQQSTINNQQSAISNQQSTISNG